MAKYWGYHLHINCGDCSDGIKSKENILEFTKALIHDIDMKAYGEPLIEHFATHDPSKGGFSLCQMIETSNICGHFVDATNECYLDIFSCKPFSEEVAIECVKKYFDPKYIETYYMTRSNPKFNVK